MELQSGLKKVASYRRKLPRKAKNIYLPTEVWVDVFRYSWISRPRMGRIVPKIGNRWFGEQLQFYLHEWGKHTLGRLYLTQQGVGRDYVDYSFWQFQYQLLEYPQTAMPENIKFCKYFSIAHFDNQVFNFFRRIQSLLRANTMLDICFKLERDLPALLIDYSDVDPNDAAVQLGNARTILGHLLPLIDGVHTLRTDDWMMPIVKTSMREKFHQVKVFDVTFTRFVQSAMQTTVEWLTTSSNTTNEPKLLQLYCYGHAIDQQFLESIRKQFNKAIEPSTFAVVFRYHRGLLNFQSENGIGEQLVGVRKEIERFEVFRHQANNAEAGDQLRQWVDAYRDGVHTQCQCICLHKPTIGDEHIFAMPDLDEDDNGEKEDDDEEKPSASKKRRICK